jgi:hypothetical protein
MIITVDMGAIVGGVAMIVFFVVAIFIVLLRSIKIIADYFFSRIFSSTNRRKADADA